MHSTLITGIIENVFVEKDLREMNCTVYVARAFCHHSQGGNPAGVVIDTPVSSFTEAQKQAIAKQLNFSETVFISPKDARSFRALYFTPNSPIAFCGHATLAAFGVLNELKLLNGSVFPLETQAGECEVTLKGHLIFLTQLLPVFKEEIQTSEIIPILGAGVSLENPYPRIVSTGLRDIFVRVRNEKCLQSLNPNLELMSDLNRKTDSIGMHVFSLDSQESRYTAHCRNFAPLFGINEESATGSSSGALACYLFEQGLLPQGSEHKLLFRQGDALNAPSDIHVHLRSLKDTITRVECGGEVVIDEVRETNADH